MKKLILYLIFYLSVAGSSAQVTLQEVLDEARKASPESTLKSIIPQQLSLELKNLQHKRLPQLGFSGQATYQSDVISFDLDVPGVEITPPSEFQYKLQGELTQLIYDGGTINHLKEASRISSQIEDVQVEMNLEIIREQVLVTFFSILELDAGLEILNYKRQDMESRKESLKSGIENGIVLESELHSIEAALIEIQQEGIEIITTRKTMIRTLSVLTGKSYNEDLVFTFPTEVPNLYTPSATLPYHELLRYQSSSVEIQQDLSNSWSKPKLSAFGHLGAGKPGLNFLNDKISEYYVVGIGMKMKLDNLYSKSNERQITQLKKAKIEAKRASYDMQLQAKYAQYENEIEKYDAIIGMNNSLLELRTQIKNVSQAQLENGVITSADYIIKLNEENTARKNIVLARTRKIKMQYHLQHLTGNYQKSF